MSQMQTSTISAGWLGKVPRYIQFPETIHELDWADLATLDLSKFNSPEGKQELAQQLQNAIQQIGNVIVLTTGREKLTKSRLLLHN
jgi:hypothetical protein